MTKKTVKLNTFFFEILNLIIIDDEKSTMVIQLIHIHHISLKDDSRTIQLKKTKLKNILICCYF